MKSFCADLSRQKFCLFKGIINVNGGEVLVIYADVLVALNVLLTYILLVAVRIFLKIPTNKWAMVIGCFVGGASALIIFWEDINIVLSLIYKLFCAGVIVAIAFLPRNVKVFLKAYTGFFLVSFIFGGGVYALQITLKPENILYYNGVVYFDMSITYLVGCVLVVYGVFLIGDYLLTRHSLKDSKCLLEITYNNLSVTLPAIVDTGNSLRDGLSGRPVIVAELSSVAPIFEREEMLFFKNQDYNNIPKSLVKKIRLVPCSGVNGESLLPSFTPDYVRITTKKGVYKTDFCTVGVVNKALSSGEYKGLVNINILENGKEEKRDEKTYL